MSSSLTDYWVVYFMVKGPVALGIAILLAAIVPAATLGRELPSRSMRWRWQFLKFLIVFLVLGYVIFIGLERDVTGTVGELLVPAMFFLIACFVHVVNCFSLETAHDIRRIATLERENSVDSLMGIFNRRYLDRALADEVARARRIEQDLSVLILDLDHFKKINDTHGHLIGDRVLAGLGQMLLGACRQGDILARYGGEEVVLIARKTSPGDAAELAERLRKVVESRLRVPIEVDGVPGELKVTTSIGVCTLDPGMRDGLALLAAADQALYEAKRLGRNRVAVGEPPPSANEVPQSALARLSAEFACKLG